MTRWVGMIVSASKVVAVDLDVQDQGIAVVVGDHTWSLQQGSRSDAYHVMFNRVADYLREHSIRNVVIKASALSTTGVKKAHLEAAELRGVVMAGAASVCKVVCSSKAALSKHFGSRKVDDYLKDASFWDKELTGIIRNGSREAAFLILAMTQQQ